MKVTTNYEIPATVVKIGLIDVDGHAKKKKWGATIYPNLALCKIARYHKRQE